MASSHRKQGRVRFKEVKGFPGYFVDTLGRVWTTKRLISKKGQSGFCVAYDGKWEQMYGRPSKGGYLQVRLRGKGRATMFYIHVLVLTHFGGPRPDGLQSAHDDGNQTNNRFDNLFWKTPKANNADKIRHGTGNEGEKHYRHKINPAIIRQIRDDYAAGMLQKDIAIKHGLCKAHICRLLKGKAWKHIQP